MSEGWIKLHRQLQEHKLWTRQKFTYGQAWVDLLLLANHDENTFAVRGVDITVPRGSVGYSQESLGRRWRWNYKTVTRFILWLEKEKMVVYKKSNVLGLIEIYKYNEYQTIGEENGVQNGEQNTDRMVTNKNEKNVKNEKKVNNMRHETKTLYDWIDGRCHELGIANKTKANTLNVYVERYLGKVQFRPTIDHYLAWMIDNNKRVLRSSAIGNCLQRKFDYNKNQELKVKDWQLAEKDPYVRAQLKGQTHPGESAQIEQSIEHFITSHQ